MVHHSDQHGEVSLSRPRRCPPRFPAVFEARRILKDNISICSDTTPRRALHVHDFWSFLSKSYMRPHYRTLAIFLPLSAGPWKQ